MYDFLSQATLKHYVKILDAYMLETLDYSVPLP